MKTKQLHYWWCAILIRCIVPVVIGIATIIRPSLLSCLYMLFLLWIPFVPVPTKETMLGHSGIFLKAMIVISVITSVSTIAFQIVLASMPPYGSILVRCEFLELVLRHVGLIRMDDLIADQLVIWIIPEVIMLVCSIAFFLLFKKLIFARDEEEEEPDEFNIFEDHMKIRKKIFYFLTSMGRYAVLVVLCLAAVLVPSVQAGIYFIVFLSSATWWACYKQLGKSFAVVLCTLLPIVTANILVLYFYQFEYLQDKVSDDYRFARYFGLDILRESTCKDGQDPRFFQWHFAEWSHWANPVVLYWLYTLIILEAKALFNPELQKKQGPFSRLDSSYKSQLGRGMSQRATKRELVHSTAKTKWQMATRKVRDEIRADKAEQKRRGENAPLLGGVGSSNKRYGSGRKGDIIQDASGSVTITGHHEDIPLDDLGMEGDRYQPTFFEKLSYALDACLQGIIRVSYLGTNIIMMAWSITYLSWLTFVLLLWANLVWAVPNQRRAMLVSSPFLVAYAWFLLLSAYVYSMNLTEEELPSKMEGVNLQQIGFIRITENKCLPLIVKCLYTTMFWVTLRQYMQERVIKKQSSALADMVAPLQVTVGAATTGTPQKKPVKLSTMDIIGAHVRKFLTKFWIWIVAITLFGVAITGERMTLFRVVYMALFLIFVLTFQLSFHIWRKMMFVFWLIVILYSMLILIATYTYQFDNFHTYWRDYLYISEEQQLDIGLEQFQIKELFVRLVTPTFFVIITVIQLHYFHKDFMKLSDPKNTTIIQDSEDEDQEDMDRSSLQGGGAVEDSEKDDPTTTTTVEYNLKDVGILSLNMQKRAESFMKNMHKLTNYTFLFLEIHMAKVVLLFAMIICVYDENAIYFVIVLLITFGLICGTIAQSIAIYTSSIIVSIILLARMVYQIKYIQPRFWNVNCTFETPNNTEYVRIENNAHWLGFRKIENFDISLPTYVKWNIYYILVVTFWSVINIRQYYYKIARNRPTTRTFFMFPKITRSHADKNLRNMIKYLFNYGFYKFGVEISLMAMVLLIGVRMDMYSVFHALWLCAFCTASRKVLSKVWILYVLFTALSLPFQYFMVIGLPPQLCMVYPYDKSEVLIRLHNWAYLMDQQYKLPAKKLLFDFILLLTISRQWVVFRIEKRYAGKNYAGGSNDPIIHLYEDPNFENPVPDYITYLRSYLDICKRMILMSFLWISLALMFLAGTNRVNIFSIGHLIGAFFFLWEGTDMYLRPIPKIVKRWNYLIAYCVVSIFVKTVLQFVGCVLIRMIPLSACWVVKLWGIGCVRKFGNIVVDAGLSDEDICTVRSEYIGVAWDGLCLIFLIIQRKIFCSYNFFHMINETKATTILASRGADLMEELRKKRIKETNMQEQTILEKIKLKMEKIKASQLKIEGAEKKSKKSHVIEQSTLARTASTTSCASATSQATATPAGYHTPIDDEEPAPLTPRSSLIQPQAPPSPYSAIMTVSLEGYLEPQRISFSSPPNSELNPRPPSPDDSFPVFSPPPYDEAPPYNEAVSELRPTAARQYSLGPPWMAGHLVTPRQSVFSYSARSHFSHHEYSIFSGRPKYRRRQPKTYKEAIRSGDYYMFDELEDDDIDLVPDVKPDEEELLDENPDFPTFINAAVRKNMHTVLQERETRIRRRLTMPYRRRSVHMIQSGPLSAISAPPNVDGKTVSIKEEQEPHPGTSHDEDLSSDSDDERAAAPKVPFGQKVRQWLIFIWALIESVMTSLTHFLNRYTKDYRYLVSTLKKEKKFLKENTNYTEGVRVGSGKMWKPGTSYDTLIKQAGNNSTQMQNSDVNDKQLNSDDSDTKIMAASPLPYSSEMERRKASVLTVPEIRIMAPSLERGLDSPYLSSRKSDTSIISAYEEEEMSQYDQPVIVRMLLSIWYIVTSRSEILCYLVVFIYQMRSASFISLPLPILALFWGSLTIPRPTKTFWVTLVAYIEVVVLVKCIFQFEIMPWHDLENYVFHAYFPAKVIGIQKQEYYANWDLVLLLVIFFHRYLLKSIGIWTHSMNRVAALLQDGEYRVEGGRFVPVNSDSQQSSKDEPSTSERTAPSTIKSKESVQTVKDAKRSKSSSGAEDPILSIRSVEIDPCDHFPQNLAFAGQKYAEAFRIFTQELLDPTSRVAADVYTYMFLCDFVNFIVLLLGFSSFGVQQDSRSIDLYLKENKVPVMFLLMLVVQFILIIIDRGIYLRKNILAKLIFQFVQVIVLHVWLFILYPIITEKEFTKVFPPQMYYFMKCCYFIISAYQIRCGYPTRILGNFCCKDYTIVNNFMFKGYMVVPFLFELRTLMDWMWTDTSLTVMDWLKMEDIYAHIFKIKCERTLEEQYPQIRGKKKNPKVKYLVGGFLLIIIIGIIWFPLVFFSLQGAVGEAHTPTSFHVKLRLGPYEPIYEMNIQETNMHPLTDREFTDMQMAYNYLKEAEDFLANYEPHDVVAIDLPQESANIWIISPPDKKSMVEELGADNELEVSFEYKLTYEDGTVNSRTALQMKPNDPERLNILHMLNGVSEKAVLPYFMPKFFKIAMGQISVVPGLLERSSKHGKEEEGSLRHVTLELFSSNETGAWQYWWKMAEDCTDKNYEHFLNLLPHDNCKTRITLYTFNEKVFPETLSFLTGGGIIGAYTTIVLVAARILRGFFGDQCFKIMFDDLPNVDRVMQLCLNVYLVREMREYALEEDLFAKLVFLFRSPETMIKWTRPKEELEEAGEEEDEEGED